MSCPAPAGHARPRFGALVLFAVFSVSVPMAVEAQAGTTGRPRPAPASAVIDTITLRADTRVLAADSLGGRGLGSDGARKAADYIRERLVEIGVRPAPNGWFQDVPIRSARLDRATVTLAAGPDSARFRSGPDFVLEAGAARAFGDFSGRAVFAGTSASALAVLQRRDVKGEVIVLAGPLDEAADSLLRALDAGGAAAILQLAPDSQFLASLNTSLGDRRFWVDADVDEPRWQSPLPRIVAGPRMSRALLALAAPGAAALQGRLDAAIDLQWHVHAVVSRTIEPVPAHNVIGWIPGTDPARRAEFVIFTAHFDHLGTRAGETDSIYNGFSDNAAGVAMLLAIAQAIRSQPWSRSVAFTFMTGEEEGLLGASFYAARPEWPLDDIRALINLDGGAPPRPPITWRLAGLPDSPLSLLADSVTRTLGWTPARTGTRANSDHWAFLARGVPALFIIPGNEWENTGAAEHDALRQRWDHYHQAGDEWSPDFNFAGLARYAFLAFSIGDAIGNR